MGAVRTSSGAGLRTIAGFCLIGLANTILPFIIFTSAYLIIPYPRPIVVLIQTLPALAVKLTLPHLVHHNIPYWTRPVVISIGWIITAVVAYFTPPNVTPSLRILTVILASALSAFGDVFWLGLLRYYGKLGLQGWGMGTGAGAMVCAVLPYFLTVVMGSFLRSGITYVYYLVLVMLVSHWFIIPPAPNSKKTKGYSHLKTDDSAFDAEDATDMIVQDPPSLPMTSTQRLEANLRLLGHLVYPFILPLVLSSAGQSMTYSGFSRAMAATPSFTRYTTYLAAYGLVFQLGNFLGRSSLLITRVHKTKVLITTMALGAGFVLLNAIFLFTSTPIVVFPLVFSIGISVGLVYIETFAVAVEEKSFDSGADREFAFGVISVGEPIGLLLGGIVGSLLESALCGLDPGSGDRWCDTTG